MTSFRPLEERDLPAFYALTADTEVARYMRFEPPRSLTEARALLAETLAQRAFAVICDGRFAGVFSLRPCGGDEYSIRMFFGKEFWGRGLATAALRDRGEYARTALRARALTAHVVCGNAASRRVLEKNGFSVARILPIDGLAGGLYVYRKELPAVSP